MKYAHVKHLREYGSPRPFTLRDVQNTRVVNRAVLAVGIVLVVAAVVSGTAGPVQVTLFWGGILVAWWAGSRERDRKRGD